MDGRLGTLEFGDFPCCGQILNTSSHLEMLSLDCRHHRLPTIWVLVCLFCCCCFSLKILESQSGLGWKGP